MTVSPLPSRPAAGWRWTGSTRPWTSSGGSRGSTCSPAELRAAVAGLEAAAARLDSARLAAARAVDVLRGVGARRGGHTAGVAARRGPAGPRGGPRPGPHRAPAAGDAAVRRRRWPPGRSSLAHVRVAARAMDANPARRAAFPAAEAVLADAARAPRPGPVRGRRGPLGRGGGPRGGRRAATSTRFAADTCTSPPSATASPSTGSSPPRPAPPCWPPCTPCPSRPGAPTRRASQPRPTSAADPRAAALEPPTPAQRRADALADLARNFLASGAAPVIGGVRPQVQLVTTQGALRRGAPAAAPPSAPAPSPAETFAPRPAELPGIGPVSDDTARRIACDATLHPLLVDPQLAAPRLGRAARTVPARPAPRHRPPRRRLPLRRLRPPRAAGATPTTSSTGPTAAPPTPTTSPSSAPSTTTSCTRAATPSPATSRSLHHPQARRHRHPRPTPSPRPPPRPPAALAGGGVPTASACRRSGRRCRRAGPAPPGRARAHRAKTAAASPGRRTSPSACRAAQG